MTAETHCLPELKATNYVNNGCKNSSKVVSTDSFCSTGHNQQSAEAESTGKFTFLFLPAQAQYAGVDPDRRDLSLINSIKHLWVNHERQPVPLIGINKQKSL